MFPFEQNLPLLPLLHVFCAISYAALIAFILIENPKAIANRLCSIVLFCFLIWCLGKVMNHFPGSPLSMAIFAQKFIIVGAWSFSSFLLLFSLALTGRNHILQRKSLWFVLAIVPTVSIVLQWYDGRLLSYVPRTFGWGLSWNPGFLSFLLLAHIFLTTFVAGCICLSYGFSTEFQGRRIQCRIIALCILLGTLIGYGTNYFAPVFNLDIPDFAQNLGLIWMGGLVFAISRYNLFVINPAMASEKIFTKMSDALIMVDRGGQIVTVNPAGLALLGTSVEKIKGTNIENIFLDGRDGTYDAERVLAGESIHDLDVKLINHLGDKIPVSMSVSGIQDERNEIAGILIIARNISERIKLKDELEESYATLEKRVRERTAELLELNTQLSSEIASRKRIE